jgi:hypothetical protein
VFYVWKRLKIWGIDLFKKRFIFRILKPQSSISTSLRFIALKEGLTDIEKITIIDSATDQTFVVSSGHQIYVRDFSRR